MRHVAIAISLFLVGLTAHAQETKVVEINSIRLYLPDDLLKQRLGDDVTPMTNYIRALEKETVAVLAAAEKASAKGLFVAVGVKPGGKSRVWCEAVDGTIEAELVTKLEQKLAAVPVVPVKNGPMAFAIEFRLRGQKPAKYPEMPKAWAEAAGKSKVPLMIPDGLFKVVWPD